MNRSQAVLLLLIAVFSVLVFVVVLPFVEYVIMAVLLAYVLFPAHRRLADRVGSLPSAVASSRCRCASSSFRSCT